MRCILAVVFRTRSALEFLDSSSRLYGKPIPTLKQLTPGVTSFNEYHLSRSTCTLSLSLSLSLSFFFFDQLSRIELVFSISSWLYNFFPPLSFFSLYYTVTIACIHLLYTSKDKKGWKARMNFFFFPSISRFPFALLIFSLSRPYSPVSISSLISRPNLFN